MWSSSTGVQGGSTVPNLLYLHLSRGSNLLEPHHRRDSKVCRVLSHEFGVVRLYRTFSTYIYTGEIRFAGCLCTSSGWLKSIEPPRTFSNHIMTEIAGRVVFIHMSSGWFDCTELSLTTSLQGKQGLQGAYALIPVVQAHRTSSNLLEPHHRGDSMVCRVLPHEWFDCTEPSLSTSLQGKQCVQGAYALVQGGSCTSHLLEPHNHRYSKVCRVHPHEFGVVRLSRTFSTLIFTGETRFAACFCTSSGCKRMEPPRTFLNHIIAEMRISSTGVQGGSIRARVCCFMNFRNDFPDKRTFTTAHLQLFT